MVGHVGKDPEVRYFDSTVANNCVASFTLATTERGYTLANGTKRPDETTWHNIVAWRGLGTIAEKYIKKGSQIYVEGKITTRSWEKDGITRYTTEIVAEKIELLERKPESGPSEKPATPTESHPFEPPETGGDDLPF